MAKKPASGSDKPIHSIIITSDVEVVADVDVSKHPNQKVGSSITFRHAAVPRKDAREALVFYSGPQGFTFTTEAGHSWFEPRSPSDTIQYVTAGTAGGVVETNVATRPLEPRDDGSDEDAQAVRDEVLRLLQADLLDKPQNHLDYVRDRIKSVFEHGAVES